jgi:hypothetical protein
MVGSIHVFKVNGEVQYLFSFSVLRAECQHFAQLIAEKAYDTFVVIKVVAKVSCFL